jgi:hypothetical protein
VGRIDDPPAYALGETCRKVSPGIVTRGAAEAKLPLDARDRHVLVRFLRSS